VIHLDTSVLIDAFTGPRRAGSSLRRAVEGGERILLSTLVLYEWLRGPRTRDELVLQEELFPRESAVPLGPAEAALAADLYRAVRAPRGREVDLGIAACALIHGAYLWSSNEGDFRDIPGLQLFRP
jgi:predicted nucleic acid-binding protein